MGKSIVRLFNQSGYVVAAGVLITNSRVITCAHVVSAITEDPLNEVIVLDFPFSDTREKYRAKVALWKPDIDIAGLSLESNAPSDIFPVPLVFNSNIWQLPFKAIGFPEGNGQNHGVWIAGRFSSQTREGWYSIDPESQVGYGLQPGFSGSPVWDETAGGVAGLVASRDERGRGYVIPTSIFPFSWVTGATVSTEDIAVAKTNNKRTDISPSVFLCHASEDKPKVKELYISLKKDGFSPWLDSENLLPGQEWDVEIRKAVKDSDAIIVSLSSNSINKRGYIQKEIRMALDVAEEIPEDVIFIIPARIDNCDVPDRLSKYHWVDLFESDGYGKLIESLKTLGEIKSPNKAN